MTTRISTFLTFQTSLNRMLRLNSEVNQQFIHLSAQKRVINAADDPSAMNSILNFSQEIGLAEQYQKNITLAEQRLATEESVLGGIETLLFRIKNLALQGNDGAYSETDRTSIANELEGRIIELVNLANQRDESGDYIFAGYQTRTQPFTINPGNIVTYNGDVGQRGAQIGSAVRVDTSDSGQFVFMEIENPYGNFAPTYNLSTAGNSATGSDVLKINYLDRVHITSAEIADRANYSPIASLASLDTYTINFLDSDNDGVIELQILDSTGAIQYPPNASSGTIELYEAGKVLSFNSIEVVLNGSTPQVGDSIVLTPQDEFSLFDVVKDTINWLKSPNGSMQEKASNALLAGTMIEYLDSAQQHNNTIRGTIGARMQLVETQEAYLTDYDIILRSARGRLEDLEVAEAISVLNQTIIALQAAQGTFSQLQSLSLFDYVI